jgi:hypothetical protein
MQAVLTQIYPHTNQSPLRIENTGICQCQSTALHTDIVTLINNNNNNTESESAARYLSQKQTHLLHMHNNMSPDFPPGPSHSGLDLFLF